MALAEGWEPADPSAAFRHLLREALISLDGASLAAEALGKRLEAGQDDYASLVGFLAAALEAVRQLDAAAGSPPKLIFPNASMARSWCAQNPLGGGLCYQIHRDGMGRCTVSISAPLAYL